MLDQLGDAGRIGVAGMTPRAVKTPPCMHRGPLERSGAIDGGQWGDDLAVPTTSIARFRRPAWTNSAGWSWLASKMSAAP